MSLLTGPTGWFYSDARFCMSWLERGVPMVEVTIDSLFQAPDDQHYFKSARLTYLEHRRNAA